MTVNGKVVTTADIDWVRDSAERLERWLNEEPRAEAWHPGVWERPIPHRWTVQCINYESLFTELWDQEWFQRGMQAFGLIALEAEGVIRLRCSASGTYEVEVSGGSIFPMQDFLNGESVPYRHDPNDADLCWEPVGAIGHVLAEYYPSS